MSRGLLIFSILFLVLFTFAGTGLAQGPKPGSVPKPAPPIGAQSLADTPEWDNLAAALAKEIGFANYIYDAWQLPPTTTWDDTFKYYSDQLVQAGWAGQGVTKDISGGKVGAWLNPDGKTGLVIVYIASPDGVKPVYDFAIFGLTTPVPAAKSEWKSIPKKPEDDKAAAQLAQAAGFGDFVYEQWEVPATVTWDDLVTYFADQMTKAGWSGATATKEISGLKVGVWLDANTNTGLVLMLVASPDGTKPALVVAIFGLPAASTTPTPAATTAPTPVAAATPQAPALKAAAPPGAKPAEKIVDWDKIAADAAKSFGFSDYAYEAWEVPATTTWDEIVKSYDDQMKQSGWSGQGVTKDISGGKVGVWMSAETKSGLVIIHVISTDGAKPAHVFAIIGKQ
jgi:hypothetical protein